MNRELPLFPQSPDTQLPKHMKFLKAIDLLICFYDRAILAIEAFYVKGNLREFDPHVGETLCQVRAYQTILLHRSNIEKNEKNALNKIIELKNKINSLEKDKKYYVKMDRVRRKDKSYYTTLYDFIEKGGYKCDFTGEEFFLIYSWFLTYYKRTCQGNRPGIDYLFLMRDLDISKNRARELVHKYQVCLSKMSCQFIFDIDKEMDDSLASQQLIKKIYKRDDDGRFVLPCYFTMSLIYKHMQYSGGIALFNINRVSNDRHIDNIQLLCEVSCFTHRLYLVDDAISSYKKEIIVFDGYVNYNNAVYENKEKYIDRFMSVGIENIVFSNMARHPQYSGLSLQQFCDNPFRDMMETKPSVSNHYSDFENVFLDMKYKSELYGCNIYRPFLFYINHIYCDIIDNWLDDESGHLNYVDNNNYAEAVL